MIINNAFHYGSYHGHAKFLAASLLLSDGRKDNLSLGAAFTFLPESVLRNKPSSNLELECSSLSCSVRVRSANG
jgi:hypothetical protein